MREEVHRNPTKGKHIWRVGKLRKKTRAALRKLVKAQSYSGLCSCLNKLASSNPCRSFCCLIGGFNIHNPVSMAVVLLVETPRQGCGCRERGLKLKDISWNIQVCRLLKLLSEYANSECLVLSPGVLGRSGSLAGVVQPGMREVLGPCLTALTPHNH